MAKVLEAAAPHEPAEGPGETDAGTQKSVLPNVTRTGLKLGTAGYMSPEQVRGEALDARTDIFSFGLVLYELATGERAFTGETEAMLHDAIVNREPEPLRERAPEVSPELSIFRRSNASRRNGRSGSNLLRKYARPYLTGNMTCRQLRRGLRTNLRVTAHVVNTGSPRSRSRRSSSRSSEASTTSVRT